MAIGAWRGGCEPGSARSTLRRAWAIRWFFVEVTARATLDSGLFALHPAGRRRIEAASKVLAPRYAGRCTTTRIDTVLVRSRALPVHLIAV
jgi:putative endonuclease